MSSLWGRFIAAMSRRGISLSLPRPAAGVDPSLDMEPMEHATGIEKREMVALAEGKDPYYICPVKRGVGSKEVPTLIPSAFDLRMVGCICSGNRAPIYMWLEKGCPKRCACGHWFKLKEVKPL